jgi:hydroxymethylbilane synthase
VRGNLDTRLRKLDAGEYGALVLAAAGLRRLGLEARISYPLPIEVSLPAVGQGALGVEARVDDPALLARLAALDHAPTRLCVTAERAAQARMRGGCTAPFGAHATLSGDTLTLHGVVADPAGEQSLTETITGPAADPTALGARLAEALLDAGAAAWISRE